MSRLQRSGIALLGATLLGACSLQPDYVRPEAPVPAEFPGPAASAAASPGAGTIETDWHKFFLDPKLSEVIARALDGNRDLRVAVANIAAARAKYGVERANLLPTIDAGGDATYGRQILTAAETGLPTSTPVHYEVHQYTTTVGFTSYELDLFGRIRSLSDSALEQYFSTEEARRSSQISLVAEVATDYLTLAADEAELAEARDTQASSQQSLDVTRARTDVGVATELDVSQAETLVDQARANVASDVTTVAQDKDALDLVVGAPVEPALLPDETMKGDVRLMAELPVGLASSVLLDRPDVLEAEHTLKSDNGQIGAARAAFFPAITLTGSGGTTSSGLSTLFRGAAAEWSFVPNISVPIFDFGAEEANLESAKAGRDADLARYEKAIQSAFRDVADALARRGTIDEELAADEAGVNAAQRALTLSEASYDRGALAYLNVLDAQRTLYTARQTLIRARLTRAANLVTLYKLLGGGAGP